MQNCLIRTDLKPDKRLNWGGIKKKKRKRKNKRREDGTEKKKKEDKCLLIYIHTGPAMLIYLFTYYANL